VVSPVPTIKLMCFLFFQLFGEEKATRILTVLLTMEVGVFHGMASVEG
jgi:hypothetical protein